MCGYIISEDQNKIEQLKNTYIHGDWTYIDKNKIGFDTVHIFDIGFPSGINDLDNIDNQKLENLTYKSREWVLQQLKFCIDSFLE